MSLIKFHKPYLNHFLLDPQTLSHKYPKHCLIEFKQLMTLPHDPLVVRDFLPSAIADSRLKRLQFAQLVRSGIGTPASRSQFFPIGPPLTQFLDPPLTSNIISHTNLSHNCPYYFMDHKHFLINASNIISETQNQAQKSSIWSFVCLVCLLLTELIYFVLCRLLDLK